MIAMLGRRSLGSECQHDIGTVPAQKEDDLANEPLGIHLFQDTVTVSWCGKRPDPENPTRHRELGATSCCQLVSRRNGDARAFSGIPISRAKQIDLFTSRGKLRDRPAGAERLVIRVGENAAETAHGSHRWTSASPVTPAQKLQHSEEDIEQVEIDLNRGRHVVILTVGARPHDPPRVEHEKPAKNEDCPSREPK